MKVINPLIYSKSILLQETPKALITEMSESEEQNGEEAFPFHSKDWELLFNENSK